MNITMLNEGGNTVQDRFEAAFQKSGLRTEGKRQIRDVFERLFVSKALWMPLYVEPGSDYGTRWRNLFDIISNTEEHQTIIIPKGQFFPSIEPERLHRKWYVLPAARWNPQRRPVISAREALEERLANFTLEGAKTLSEVPIALDFQGIGKDGDYRITTPFDWLRAKTMYTAFGKQIDIKIREGREDLSNMFSQGVIIEAKGVPSFSGESAPHELVLRNVAVYEERRGLTDKARIVSYGLRTSDDCGRHTYAEEKFSRLMNPAFGESERKGEETDIDHHTGVVLRAAEDVMARQRPGLALYSPIPNIPEGVEEFVDAAFKRVMVTEGRENGRFMLWEYKAFMKIYTMMAAAYINTPRRTEERALPRVTAA